MLSNYDNDTNFRVVNADGPVAIAISINIQRRHLTPQQRRELIAALLKADPEKSDRQIAETEKPARPRSARCAAMETAGDVSKLDTRTDKRGRQQPAKRAALRLVKTEMVPAPKEEEAPPPIVQTEAVKPMATGPNSCANINAPSVLIAAAADRAPWLVVCQRAP
jgi:hypothetical protein